MDRLPKSCQWKIAGILAFGAIAIAATAAAVQSTDTTPEGKIEAHA